MKKLISCAFNIDTACVELHFTDGSIYSINCTAVENEVADMPINLGVSYTYFFNLHEEDKTK